MKTLCVFCGSADNVHTEYIEAARQIGSIAVANGINIVYGAGSTGLMGALADAALEKGGEVIGIIPKIFNTQKLVHNNLTRLEVVETLHQRKARMIEYADAFIALPGGFGTFEELFETLTWAQIGIHQKPIGLLNTRHYFDRFLALVDHAQNEGFIYSQHSSLFVHAVEPERLIKNMGKYKTPQGLERWVNR